MISIETLIAEAGFDEAIGFDPTLLKSEEKVRAACGNGFCPNFGHNPLCPPAAPPLGECERILHSFPHALLTVSHTVLPEGFSDYDAAVKRHNARVLDLEASIRACGLSERTLTLSTGACEGCAVCTYPAPCRRPDRHRESVCGFGIDVLDLCRTLGAEYRFVKGELFLVSLILF